MPPCLYIIKNLHTTYRAFKGVENSIEVPPSPIRRSYFWTLPTAFNAKYNDQSKFSIQILYSFHLKHGSENYVKALHNFRSLLQLCKVDDGVAGYLWCGSGADSFTMGGLVATMANRSAATQSGDADEEDFEDSKDMAINITFDLILNKDSRDGCTCTMHI